MQVLSSKRPVYHGLYGIIIGFGAWFLYSVERRTLLEKMQKYFLLTLTLLSCWFCFRFFRSLSPFWSSVLRSSVFCRSINNIKTKQKIVFYLVYILILHLKFTWLKGKKKENKIEEATYTLIRFLRRPTKVKQLPLAWVCLAWNCRH